MKERERVFELVKQGIITTEEALVLLENMATEKDEKIVKKEAINVKQMTNLSETDECFEKAEPTLTEMPNLEEAQGNAWQKLAESEEADRQRLEKILDDLATQTNRASVSLDEVTAELEGLEVEIKEKQEELMVLNTMEELEALTPEQSHQRIALEEDLQVLHVTKRGLEAEQAEYEEQLSTLHKEKKATEKGQKEEGFDFTEDLEDTLNEFGQKFGEASSNFGRKMGIAGVQLGRFVKDTIKTVSETVNDNVDWKDVNIKVPGMASNSFQHEFYYPETTASLIDVKIANGQVTFSSWDSADVKVDATIKLYGKMSADTPFEAFLERSQICVDDDTILFQIPNKRIRVDLHFYLPKRVYDHVSVKLLNGDVDMQDIEAKDIFLKSTNGDMVLKNVAATMLEVEGVNGNVVVKESSIMDLLAESVNGDFVIQSMIENASISNVNGDIKITAQKENLKKIEAKVVNGTIKVAIPEEVGIEGLVKTSIGSIKNRMTNYDVIREKNDKTNQMLQFRRFNEEKTVYLNLSTTTGSIYLKDCDKV